jgi:nucleoside-diphosphate-sugar epimerase
VKQIIVFGGSGFIGSHLVSELSKRFEGKFFIADIRQPQVPLPPNVIYEYCDVRQPIPANLGGETSLVVDLAAIAREPGYPASAYYETNVNGAKNISEFCANVGIRAIWFTSTMSVYGPSEEPKPETAKPTPETPYGNSKIQAEEIYRAWQRQEAGRRLLIVRPAVIFGARDNGNFTKLARSLRQRMFVYPGRKDTIKACGYVEDLVNSLHFMDAQKEDYLVYNFAYPTPYTIEDICNAFCEVAGFPRPWGMIPFPLMLAGSQVFKWLNELGIRNPIHPQRMYKLVRSTYILPAELNQRGFRFHTDLKEGLRKWLLAEPVGEFI